jgi:predicted NBD/HSP70 family sugar kinase
LEKENEKVRVRTGNQAMVREVNRALILDLLRRNDVISRVQIAKTLRLSKFTVSAIVNELIEQEFVIESGKGDAPKKGGPKPILLSLNTSGAFVVGVDIEIKHTIVAIGNLKGELLLKTCIPTVREYSVENVVEQVSSLIDKSIQQAGIARDSILGLGVSIGGLIDKTTGIIAFSPNFHWENVHFAEILENSTGLQTVIDHSTRVMALGEQWYGCAKHVKNMFYINMGYGIGSTIVVDGRISPNHCEFGHTFVTKKDVHCTCGKTGCLEAVASIRAIEEIANEQLHDSGEDRLTAKMVADLANQGDAAAKNIVMEAGRYLGRSISIVANLLNPDKIVIGGEIAFAEHLLLVSILTEYEKNTLDLIKKHATVEISSLGMDSGVFGAVALSLDKFVFKQAMINPA